MSKRRGPGVRPQRYYTQHIYPPNNTNFNMEHILPPTLPPTDTQPHLPVGWWVFDRGSASVEALPIGWAIDNRQARHIVRALNNMNNNH